MEVKIKNNMNIEKIVRVYKLKIKVFIEGKAMDWESETKQIVSSEIGSDTGELLNSYFTELLPDDAGFKGISSSKHAKYFEFGTVQHWVPFYSRSGKPMLANWAKRVLGMDEAEMEEMKGMMVRISEVAPMRRSLNKL